MTDWRRVQGSQQAEPPLFDTESSATTVYQHRNIKRVEDEENGEKTVGWEYDEREMSREEYKALKTELEIAQCRADIEWISMNVGVELA